MSDWDNLIKWENRYSDTMEDDDMGRWARIANCGILNDGMPFIDGKVSIHQIAWINRLNYSNKIHYMVSFYFPHKGKSSFKTLDEAKNEVENSFKFFIQTTIKSIGINF